MAVRGHTMPLFKPRKQLSLSDCRIVPTASYKLVSMLVCRWHRTLPIAPPGFRVAFVGTDGASSLISVAMWGRPVARLEDQEKTLELTRLAHSPYVPRNFGSWGLARMRKWIRLNMSQIMRLISYQDASVHNGALYKSDNWHEVYEKETSHSWTNRPGRLGTEQKHRKKWERKP